ncbi:GTP-binding protein [Histomonas meleagridis]|uniref:GTP-binding protein n=1 Tax=Histomonas meleagridis TaxID=135588 RepID=UPI00355A481A|nr:GTP-binding protein [Histomonas meleagridis]
MLLPAKPQPTTAIIGEIIYSEEPEVILYPKKNDLRHPLAIRVEELSKYVTIDTTEIEEEQVRKDNPYEKVVIKYPLNMCRHGVMFIDSPGTDDPSCHDVITRDYLPKADAIIYCMNAQQAFTQHDKFEIERLYALGYRSIIFVLTYFDIIQNNDEIEGTNHQAELKKLFTNTLSHYTDLGSDGIFFVGSLPALRAKRIGNSDLLESSNFPPLEKKLEQILFNQKGRMKIYKWLYLTRQINRRTLQQITDHIEIYNTDKNKLRDNLQKVHDSLTQAETKTNEVLAQFKIVIMSLINECKVQGQDFFMEQVMPKVDKWVSDFTPGEGQDITLLHPIDSVKIFTESCVKFIQGQIEAELAKWIENEIVPNVVILRIQEFAKQQEANIQAIENYIKDVRSELNLKFTEDEIAESETASAANRILSMIVGVLTCGPGGAIAGGLMGWKSLIPIFIGEFLVGFAFGFFAISLNLPLSLLVSFVTTLIGGGITQFNLKKRLKEKIKEMLKEELTKQQSKIVGCIGDAVFGSISEIQNAMEQVLIDPVENHRKLFMEVETTINSESSIIQEKVEILKKLRNNNNEITSKIEEFEKRINL